MVYLGSLNNFCHRKESLSKVHSAKIVAVYASQHKLAVGCDD